MVRLASEQGAPRVLTGRHGKRAPPLLPQLTDSQWHPPRLPRAPQSRHRSSASEAHPCRILSGPTPCRVDQDKSSSLPGRWEGSGQEFVGGRIWTRGARAVSGSAAARHAPSFRRILARCADHGQITRFSMLLACCFVFESGRDGSQANRSISWTGSKDTVGRVPSSQARSTCAHAP